MWTKGWHTKDVARMKNIGRPVIIGKEVIAMVQTKNIPSYFNDENFFLIQLWDRWRRFGNPWNAAWSKWPYWAIQAIEWLECAYKGMK